MYKESHCSTVLMVPLNSQISQLHLSLGLPKRVPWFDSHLNPMADLPAAFSSVSNHQGKLVVIATEGMPCMSYTFFD